MPDPSLATLSGGQPPPDRVPVAPRAAGAPSLYRRLLGSAWSSLHPVLQGMHDGPALLSGTFVVERGRGPLARLLAWVMRLPRAGRAEVTLRVTERGGAQTWSRRFGSQGTVRTCQWEHRGVLWEGLGPIACGFRLAAEGGALVFEQVGAGLRTPFVRIPLPRWLWPRIEARADPAPRGGHIRVTLSAPVAGMLVRYDGIARPSAGGEEALS